MLSRLIMASAPPPTPVVSIWQLKPWWCQPWSILITGMTVVTLSWLWLQLWWITAVVAAVVVVWWGLFLVLVPRAWRESQAESDSSG